MAKDYKQKLLFGSFSRISDNIKKKKKNQIKRRKAPKSQTEKVKKKTQAKIYLIIKVIFLEQSVSHKGYYYLMMK